MFISVATVSEDILNGLISLGLDEKRAKELSLEHGPDVYSDINSDLDSMIENIYVEETGEE